MKCPYCKSENNYVIGHSQANYPDGSVHRRRRCRGCGRNYYTVEAVALDEEARGKKNHERFILRLEEEQHRKHHTLLYKGSVEGHKTDNTDTRISQAIRRRLGRGENEGKSKDYRYSMGGLICTDLRMNRLPNW